jgi:hypothetical protein
MKKTCLFVYLCVLANAFAGNFYNQTPYDNEEPSILRQGALIGLSCDITSKPAKPGQTAEYTIDIENLSKESQTVTLSLKPDKWAIMPVVVTPETLKIQPGEHKTCTVKMTAVDKLPKGAHERRTLIAAPNDAYKSEEIELVTVRYLDHPNMFLSEELVKEVKQKIEKYPWAQKNFEQLKKDAANWNPPGEKKYTIKRKGVTWQGLFPNNCTERAWEVAMVWKLTGDAQYRDKLLKFIKAVADPQTGYVTTRWATDSDAYVHEGGFFTFYPALYDIFYDDPGLTEADHKNIENALRLYMKTCKAWHREGDIGNWVIGANVGAIISSVVLQDIKNMEYFLYCPKGFKEQMSLGLMADGWWYEGASNYSYLTARIYGYTAKCCESFGINLFDMYVPARYMGENGRRWKNGWMSMNFDIWGPTGKSYRCLKDLYDGATILMDENGYVAANNDSEPKKPGDVFELGYYHYKDPTYLWIIDKDDRMSWQSLLYGVGQVGNSPDPRSISGHADNVGIAALRSQKKDQKPNEQIQAFLKWGTHGGWHGHFDRISFMMLRRYGTDLFLPRPSFFGYSDPRYKAWVQPSISHNMVIVDQYQQEPVESKLLLFYGGTAIQACAVETNARWVQKLPWDINDPGDLDAGNMKKMVNYGDAEPVLQRRLMIVTDDYILVSDYLRGKREHTFDWLVHPVGYLKTLSDSVKKTEHTERISDDPNSSYYYITDCDWSEVSENVLNQFKDENVRLDIHTVFDGSMKMAIGTYPSSKPEPDEAKRRTLLFRTQGKEFRFISLFEPYQEKAVVKNVTVNKEGAVIVQLQDGRTQTIEIKNFESEGQNIQVKLTESQDGRVIRSESTKNQQ